MGVAGSWAATDGDQPARFDRLTTGRAAPPSLRPSGPSGCPTTATAGQTWSSRGLGHRDGGHRGRGRAGRERQPERGGGAVLHRRGPDAGAGSAGDRRARACAAVAGRRRSPPDGELTRPPGGDGTRSCVPSVATAAAAPPGGEALSGRRPAPTCRRATMEAGPPVHERTDMNNNPTPYPLAWPTGWPRTRPGDRERSRVQERPRRR